MSVTFHRQHIALKLPVRPRSSAEGHPLPFVHPSLAATLPGTWPAWWARLFGVAMAPLLRKVGRMAFETARHWRGPLARSVSTQAQRLGFWAWCRSQEQGVDDAEQLPVVFPGATEVTPIEAGIAEAVFVLHAMGCPTVASCQGHEAGGVAYVLLAPGHRFPDSVFASLKAQGIAHELRQFEDGRQGLYPPVDQPGAPLAEGLRAWARQHSTTLVAAPPLR